MAAEILSNSAVVPAESWASTRGKTTKTLIALGDLLRRIAERAQVRLYHLITSSCQRPSPCRARAGSLHFIPSEMTMARVFSIAC